MRGRDNEWQRTTVRASGIERPMTGGADRWGNINVRVSSSSAEVVDGPQALKKHQSLASFLDEHTPSWTDMLWPTSSSTKYVFDRFIGKSGELERL